MEAQDRTWVCGMKELPYYIIVEGRVKFQRPSQAGRHVTHRVTSRVPRQAAWKHTGSCETWSQNWRDVALVAFFGQRKSSPSMSFFSTGP